MGQTVRIIVYLLAGVFGLCVGSFLNVVIYRLPRGMSLVSPSSHCPACGARIRPYDNIPLLSYLILRGRCRRCGARISPRYPAVELANCLLWLGSAAWFYGCGMGMVAVGCVASSALIVVFCADLETMLIPDSAVIVLVLCAVAALLLDVFGMGTGVAWQDRLIGMAAAFVFFALLHFVPKLARRECLGFGDVKLMTAAGLLLGWQSLLAAVLFGSAAAALVMLPLAFSRERGAERAFPFAPFLAAAVLVCLFFGQDAVAWYLGLFA